MKFLLGMSIGVMTAGISFIVGFGTACAVLGKDSNDSKNYRDKYRYSYAYRDYRKENDNEF